MTLDELKELKSNGVPMLVKVVRVKGGYHSAVYAALPKGRSKEPAILWKLVHKSDVVMSVYAESDAAALKVELGLPGGEAADKALVCADADGNCLVVKACAELLKHGKYDARSLPLHPRGIQQYPAALMKDEAYAKRVAKYVG